MSDCVSRCRGVRRLAGSPPRGPDRRLQGGARGVPGETSERRHPIHQKQAAQDKVDRGTVWATSHQFRREFGCVLLTRFYRLDRRKMFVLFKTQRQQRPFLIFFFFFEKDKSLSWNLANQDLFMSCSIKICYNFHTIFKELFQL